VQKKLAAHEDRIFANFIILHLKQHRCGPTIIVDSLNYHGAANSWKIKVFFVMLTVVMFSA